MGETTIPSGADGYRIVLKGAIRHVRFSNMRWDNTGATQGYGLLYIACQCGLMEFDGLTVVDPAGYQLLNNVLARIQPGAVIRHLRVHRFAWARGA